MAQDTNATVWKSERHVQDWLASMGERERKRADQYRLLAYLLPFEPDDRFTLLDLGAGTGAASRAILSFYPNAQAILADFSPHMMGVGARIMEPFEGRYRYVEFDMLGSRWPGEIPATVDAAVTANCVHHLPNERKRTLFAEILQRLNPGGWYVNYDPIKAADPAVEAEWERVNLRLDPDTARRHAPTTPEQHEMRENHVRHMTDLERQVGYLREAGFEAVDVYWKQLDSVIYGGRRVR